MNQSEQSTALRPPISDAPGSKTQDACVATTFPGLERACEAELAALGLPILSVSPGAVIFGGGRESLYRATLWSRVALHILRPIANFRASDPDELYAKVRRIRWERWLSTTTTFSIDSTVRSEVFAHSHYVSLKTKDALVDRLRERMGQRPDVDIEHPEVRIRVRVRDTQFQLYLDTGRESLHRRGYRLDQGEAPLNETVAAAMLAFAGYDGSLPLVDPFCGAGTILIEAAMMASRIAPGLLRKSHALEHWVDHDPSLWETLGRDAEAKRISSSATLLGGDEDSSSIAKARLNAERAGVCSQLSLGVQDCRELSPPAGPGLVVTNPPYGKRLADEDLSQLYRDLGDRFKQAYDNYDAWVLCGSTELLKRVGLRADRRIPILNGNLECRFARFSIRGRRPKIESGAVNT